MIFRALNDQLYLTLHTPNEKLKEHPIFIPLNEDGDNIMVLGE